MVIPGTPVRRSSATAPGFPRNRLLDRLAAPERARVLLACDHVDLAFGQVLDVPGAEAQYVYFPTSGAISSLLPMQGGHAIEVALVGDEGLHGAAFARGHALSAVRAEVHVAGSAWRLATADLRAMARAPALSETVDGYLDAVRTQLVQATGCHRFHCVEQRVARWLLMTADRAHASRFGFTHELLAHALGVRRVGVTNAAGALQRRALIACERGVVAIVDRRGLERASCACYRADLQAYERALPPAFPPAPAGRRPSRTYAAG